MTTDPGIPSCHLTTIFRKSGSPYWWAAFFTAEGKRRYLSTKKRVKVEAIVVGTEWEKRARKAVPKDDEKRKTPPPSPRKCR